MTIKPRKVKPRREKRLEKSQKKKNSFPTRITLISTYLLTLRIRHMEFFELFRQLSAEIEVYLKEDFYFLYKQIMIIALLRLSDTVNKQEMLYMFRSSYLMDLYPDIGFCEGSVVSNLHKLSQM